MVMDMVRNARNAGRHIGLLRLLNLSSQAKATEAQDKVYGLLGLAQDGDLVPNVKLEPDEVYLT